MTVANDALRALTLELGFDTVPHADFQRIIRAFTGLLDTIAEEACGKPSAIRWDLSISSGSLNIAANMSAGTDTEFIGQVMSIISNPNGRIRRELSQFPLLVPETRILAGADGKNILQEESKKPDWHPSQISEYGTVEGILETLSSRGSIRFTISEPIWNIAVRCTVPDALVSTMQQMWRKRVAAHGIVNYDRNGHPTSIRAEDVEPFPYDDTPIEAYRGLYSVN